MWSIYSHCIISTPIAHSCRSAAYHGGAMAAVLVKLLFCMPKIRMWSKVLPTYASYRTHAQVQYIQSRRCYGINFGFIYYFVCLKLDVIESLTYICTSQSNPQRFGFEFKARLLVVIDIVWSFTIYLYARWKSEPWQNNMIHNCHVRLISHSFFILLRHDGVISWCK